MTKRWIGLTPLAWALALGVGHAAESGPVATAPAGSGAPTAAEATRAQIAEFHAQGALADTQAADMTPPPRAIHGEVGAAVGTAGYRSAYGVVDIPIGAGSNLGLAASQTRFPSRHGRGGGTRTSLAVDLRLQGSPFHGADCMRRTGLRLRSDEAMDAACARAVANDGRAPALAPIDADDRSAVEQR